MNLLQKWVALEENFKHYSLVFHILLLTFNILIDPFNGTSHSEHIVYLNLWHILSIITVICYMVSERIKKERLRERVKAVLAVMVTVMNMVGVFHAIIIVIKAAEILRSVFYPHQSIFYRVI